VFLFRKAESVPLNRTLPGAPQQRFLELRRGLEQIEYFCKGTVLKRMMKCGKAQCACASDAAKRHGPYFELTYKANGKTVNRQTLTGQRHRCTRPQLSSTAS
jgi:hypothetical protein